MGNAERFAAQNGAEVRYCYAWRQWLVWDGKRWRTDTTGETERRAKATVKSIPTEARRVPDDLAQKINDFARRCESKSAVDAILGLGRSEGTIPVQPEDLDRDPMLFNCQNGTINLRTGKLRPHRRADLITTLSPVDYDPKAECPKFLKFLETVCGGDQDLIAFLQRAVGYTLTGSVNEKALLVLWGNGDNGKTTLLEAIRHILGDYAAMIDIDVLMQNSATSERQYAVASLLGKRYVTSSEAEEGQRLREATIKNLTGMGRQTGRRIYGAPFEFEPMFKLFIDANHKPVIRGTDQAIWNRIRLIPFSVSVPKDQQDKNLAKKLRDEASGILAWAVRGCLKWQKHGLGSCTAVTDAVADYRTQMDLVADFLTDCCETGSGYWVAFKDLYAAFVQWCNGIGETPLTQTAFGTRLEAKGYASNRTAGTRCRTGLRLKSSVKP
jgi:putative DNA primase/helicase